MKNFDVHLTYASPPQLTFEVRAPDKYHALTIALRRAREEMGETRNPKRKKVRERQ